MVLRAESTVEVAAPAELLTRLCEHYAEHGDVSYSDDGARVVVSFGEARLRVAGAALHLVAEARDETGLAYVKMGVTSHLLEFSKGVAPAIRWQGDGAAGVAPPFFRVMQVVGTRRLTPHMQRVTLRGENLSRFAEGGLHMRLAFPRAGRQPIWPVMGEDGMPRWAQGEDQLSLRVYTIRNIDPAAGLVDVDMVLHPGASNPGADFAETAAPGDLVGMSGPGGGFYPPHKRLLLLGDETALPAIGRIIEAAAADVEVRAVIEVDGPAEEQEIETASRLELTWLHRNGRPAGTTQSLAQAFLDRTSDGLGDDVFVWAGCEFEDFRAIRRHARQVLKIGRDRHLVAAYWRRGAAGDEARKGAREAD